MVKFLDEKGDIRKEVVGKEAQNWADKLTARRKLTSHQLRRFYNEFKTLERKLEHKTANQGVDEQQAFDEVLPLVMLTLPKLLYAKERGVAPEEFASWLKGCLEGIKGDVKNFRAFMLHFEAVLGFCYGTGKLKKN